MFRDRIAGKAALVVLDNAATEDQVRPLLPGDSGAVTLITSRRSLAQLDGVLPMQLAVVEPRQSVTLQARIAGAERIAAEPEAAARVAANCGHLPLALSLAARQLRTRPTWSVANLARRLDEGVEQFDSARSVRTMFDISYRSLPREWARVFRLLGLHPGRVYTAVSTAAIAGISVSCAENALEHLFDEHLLTQAAPGSYTFHDLVLSYAVSRTGSDDTEQERAEAVRRVLAWFLDTVLACQRKIDPLRRVTPAGSGPVDGVPVFADHDDALAWCEAARPTLVEAVRLAVRSGLPAIAWRLCEALASFFYLRSYWSDWAATHLVALAAAEQSDDLRGQAILLRALDNMYGDLCQFDHAIDAYQRTHQILTALDDRWGQAWNLNNLAVAYIELREFTKALSCLHSRCRCSSPATTGTVRRSAW